MTRQYNLIAQSATTALLQDIDSKAVITLPSYLLPSYEHLIVPIFNMDCFEA